MSEVRNWQPTKERVTWLSLATTSVLLPHTTHLPIWISIGYAVFVLWRLLHTFRGVPLPSRWFMMLMVTVVITGAAIDYRSVLGRDAGVALLAGLAGLKTLEIKIQRDAYVVIYLGLFLIVTNFLYSQTIGTGTYMLMVTVVYTVCLRVVAVAGPSETVLYRLNSAGRIVVQSLPLAVFLFILFPRLPGPLWSLPEDAHAGLSGLSDTMQPGHISQLSLSDKVAFRVRFDSRPPPPDKLYWRGPVMWDTDGNSWTANTRPRSRRLPAMEVTGTTISYEMTLEPHGRRWMFPLDVPTYVPRGAMVTPDLQLLSLRKITDRRRIRMSSHVEYSMAALSVGDRGRALALPRGKHLKARELALSMRLRNTNDEALVNDLLKYFREMPFYYTLRPPLPGPDPVDGFLFDTRTGFCEHYAAAFVVLARAAGIPARIVTGYQGGERNPLGDYLIVRQRDAHAWAEIWTAGLGWHRVDPTAAVVPDRIEHGMDAAIPPIIGPDLLGIQPPKGLQEWLRSLRHGLDTINNSWNQWILGYGSIRQRAFLAALGLDARDWRQVGVWILVSLLFCISLVAWWVWRGQQPVPDPVVKLYQGFTTKLSRIGVSTHPTEGPLSLVDRVGSLRPDLRSEVTRIAGLYVGLRYRDDDTTVAEFAQAVKCFRPKQDGK